MEALFFLFRQQCCCLKRRVVVTTGVINGVGRDYRNDVKSGYRELIMNTYKPTKGTIFLCLIKRFLT